MDARHWLREMRSELAKHNLPSLYSERLLSELLDHITDSLEDSMSTDALGRSGAARLLGRPADVAENAVNEFRKRKFLGRHPLLAFVALPIFTLPLLWIVTLATFAIGAKLCGFGSDGTLSTTQLPAWLHSALASLVFSLVLVPIAVSAWLFCRIARSTGAAWKWPLVACAIVAVIGSAAFLDVALPGTNQHGLLHDTRFAPAVLEQNTQHGAVTMGMGFSLNNRPHWWQIVQFCVPLAICGVAVYREIAATRRNMLAG